MHSLGQRGSGWHGAVWVDQRSQSGGSFGGQHMGQPGGMIRIRQKPIACIISKFCRLCLDMRAGGAERVKRGQIKLCQDIEQQNRRCPLTIWRMLQQFNTAVGARNGVSIVAGNGGEIFQRVTATQGTQRRNHIVGNLALVKPGPAFGGNGAQNIGLARGAKHLPRGRRVTLQKVELPRISLQIISSLAPVKGSAGCHGHAIFCIMYGGRKRLSQIQSAPIGGQAAKRIHCTGQCDRFHAVHRHRI